MHVPAGVGFSVGRKQEIDQCCQCYKYEAAACACGLSEDSDLEWVCRQATQIYVD